ncbi:RpiB/LacA/LacB family sugar-phosphate isomerase [Candidatus Woesearchaeota archaeon]|nr:RpiB/LacA/LacB family sugar-phosphate isomerase [Candidatus Woesearchaeota archaeon]
MKQIIYIGADHAGFELKESLKKYLSKLGYKIKDLGNTKFDPKDDYPDFAFSVAKQASKTKSKGILVCGSAEGVCIAANKVKGVRAVPVWTVSIAKLSRKHNDANVLCLAGGGMLEKGKGLSNKLAEKIVLTWLRTPFSKEKRHVRRLKKIKKYENTSSY